MRQNSCGGLKVQGQVILNPTKERVREWMNERRQSHAPLPDRDEIRRQLGWGLVSVLDQVRR